MHKWMTIIAMFCLAMPLRGAVEELGVSTLIEDALRRVSAPVSGWSAPTIPRVRENVEQIVAQRLEHDAALGQWRARMVCVPESACVPFYVLLRDAPLRTTLSGTVSAKAVVVHAGAAATLLASTPQMRWSERVTCLQNGSLGQTIRVRTVAGGRLIRAVVTGPNQLAPEGM